MRILYLDDSGKIHPNDPAKMVVFGGFSVDEESWHRVVRRVPGAKSSSFPNRGSPHDWEIKCHDLLTSNSWNRRKNREFCFSIPAILRDSGCYVYAVSMEKSNAVGILNEERFVPLAFQRLVAKFNSEITFSDTTGSIVCDWSTHQLDRHLTHCITSMAITRYMFRLRGGITYGSSRALLPLQVADLIAGTIRRSLEGQGSLIDLAKQFEALRYTKPGAQDGLGFPVDCIFKLF